LEDVTAVIHGGSVCAVVDGGDGFGASKLLQLLSASPECHLDWGGMIYVNECEIDSMIDYHPMIAYFSGVDTTKPYLTVEENLQLAAGLTMPKQTPHSERQGAVVDVLGMLGLLPIRSHIVGTHGIDYHSILPSQRQRLLLGMQIVKRPHLLLLDNPLASMDLASSIAFMAVLGFFFLMNLIYILSFFSTFCCF